MKYSRPIIIFSFIAVLSIIACKTKKVVTTTEETKACDSKVTYQTLEPILSKSCNSMYCHGNGGKMGLTTYANVKKLGLEGEIKEHVLVEKDMPRGGKLTSEELQVFRCWIEGGMLEK